MVTNFSVTNENYTQSPIYIGMPENVALNKFNVGIVKHAVLPGDRAGSPKGLAVFQETVLKGISIIHIQIETETARTVKVKATAPALILTIALRGSPSIQWAHLEMNNYISGQFYLCYAHRHLQTIKVKPGTTELLNIHLELKHLQVALDFNKQMERFLNLASRGKSVSYLARPIYGSPLQQYRVYQLISKLCTEGRHVYEQNNLMNQLLMHSIRELELPDTFNFTFEETEEMAAITKVFTDYYSVPNIYQKEIRRSSFEKDRFDSAFMQIWDCTALEFIKSAQMKMAKKMLEEGYPLHMVIRVIGYKSKIGKFNLDFHAYCGIHLLQFLRRYEGRPW